MNWNQFFKEKKKLKFIGIGVGIVSGFSMMQISSFYFIFHRKFDPTVTWMGMDQSIFYFGGILVGTLGGYVVGNVLGPKLYKFRHFCFDIGHYY